MKRRAIERKSDHLADKVDAGINRNLNHVEYYTRTGGDPEE